MIFVGLFDFRVFCLWGFFLGGGREYFLRRKKQRQDSKKESEMWTKANVGLLACCFSSRKDAS